MHGISNENEYAINGGGYPMRGYGGYGGFGGNGIIDLAMLGLIFGDGFLGNRRRDGECCPRPATEQEVCAVDRDVLSTANQTQHEICEATHDIETAQAAGFTNLSDKMNNGFYALSDKISALAYAQQATAKDTQTLISQQFCELKTSQLAAANCALEQEVNRFKTIEALAHCHGRYMGKD